MIYVFIALILGTGIFEVHGMVKRKEKKEIAIYIVFALITIAFGCFYILNPYRESLSQRILTIIGKRY